MSPSCFTPEQLAAWSGGRWSRAPSLPVAGFAIDTRALKAGELFVALPGGKVDGHSFLDAARAAGAAGAVVRRGARASGDLPLLEVEDPKAALTALARGHRARLDGVFVAVTGSSGKTSVKELIADLLEAAGSTARTRGNWNNDIGLPLSLLTMRPDDRFGVFEVGMNHPGELDPLCALLRPHVSVVTSVGPVHIEHFESEEGIAHEKAAVLRALAPNGLAVLPMDDRWFNTLRGHVTCALKTVSLAQEADYRVEAGAPPRFVVTEWASGESALFDAPLPGRYVLSNAGLAIAVARHFGIDWDALAPRVRHFRPPGMRWAPRDIDGVLFINDAYNANPMSMRAALDGFRASPAQGRRWLVLGAMRELGTHAEAEHVDLGRALAGGPWAGLVAVGPEGEWIRRGALDAGFCNVFGAADPEDAARLLKGLIQPGDVVLLKASRGVALERLLDCYE
jgi:UDP-N-acetylmuramoyl-tripeptide--D-alanyl-D-alanine ligase